jgi:hypothetical protein
LIALGAIAYKLLPQNQLPQIVSIVVVVGLGLVLGISAARNRSWFLRAALVLAGFGAAVAAWWFVPTTGGLSLYAAERAADYLSAELQALPPGDSARFFELEETRNQLAEEFPEYNPRLEELAEQWRKRSEVKWESDLNRLGRDDFDGLADLRQAYEALFCARLDEAELAWFKKNYQRLAPGDFSGELKLRALARSEEHWKTKIWTWEDEWAERTVDAVRRKTDRLLAGDPFMASRQLKETARHLANLGQHDEAQNRLLSARVRAFRAALESARSEAYGQVIKEQFQAAEFTARALRVRWEDEAKAVGEGDELARFCDGYEFLAEMAQRAKKKDPK